VEYRWSLGGGPVTAVVSLPVGEMGKRLPVVVAYLVLLALALPIPLLHHWQTAKAIENRRPFMRLEDGTLLPMLMPMHILLLRGLGQFSRYVAVAAFALFVLSFWRESLRRCTTVCCIAICQCAFTTFYALYATLLIGFEWLHRAG
jgi:hypothetical protein